MKSNGRKHRLAKILFFAIQIWTAYSASVSAASNDPCDNFYKYACENPANDREYASLVKQAQINVFKNLKHVIKSLNSDCNNELLKKWQTFYASCKNSENINAYGITPLNSVLNKFGGWPLSNSPSTDSLPKLDDILSFYGKLKVFPLFQVVAHDDKFHKENKIMISQPHTTFSEGIEKASQSDVSRYTNFIKRIIKAIVSSNRAEISQDTAALNVANEIVAFEIELSKILLSRHELNIYKPTTLKDFQSKSDQNIFNWKNIINGLSTVEFVSDEDKIDVSTDSYYPKLIKLLQETPARTVLNYIHWRFVVQYLPYTSDDLRSLYFEYKDLLQNPEQETTRSNSCIFEPVLDPILSYQYAKDYITPDIESSVHQILTDIKEATIKTVKVSSLLNEDEKRAVEKKVSLMKFVFGVAENVKNFEAISDFYNTWTVGDNYFENILAINRFTTAKELEKIKKLVFVDNSADNFMRVTNLLDFGIKYDFLDNTVYIKPENLVQPLFSSDGSNVQKYGLLGFTIAEGILMALVEADSIESYVDGRFKKLYSDETRERFWNRSDCFLNQFISDSANNYEDSQNSVSYNMADTTALQIAYKAFRSKQTAEASPEDSREFFTLFVKLICRPELQDFSTEWSLGLTKPQYRVMGSLPNIRQFAQAFTCSSGARMNPERICSFLN